jgi:hypothetical protein
MNIIDLAFDYDIKIDFDGDFDGGNYHIKMNYVTATNHGTGETETIIVLDQVDIDKLYAGANKLIETLKHHITTGY